MLSQRNGFLLRSLRVLIFQLLLTQFCRGQSRLIGPLQPIVAKIGDDIILPCYLEPTQDVFAMTLEWTRSDLNSMFVYVCRDGQDLIHTKHPYYKDRTSLSTDELKHGNVSLKLSKVKLTDQGTYKCYIPKLETTSFVDLVVDDFIEVQFSYFAATVGLAVSLAVCVLLIVLLLFFVWKRRQNITKTKRGHRAETVDGEKKNDSKSNKTEDQLVTEDEREREKLLRDETVQMEDSNKGKEKENKKHKKKSEQHRREEAENTMKILKEELETKKKELEIKQTELQQLCEEKQRNENDLQTQKEELEHKNKELETIQASLAQYSKWSFWNLRIKEEQQKKKTDAEKEVEALKKKLEIQGKELDTKIKELKDKQAEVQQLQDEYQGVETNMQNKMLELESTKEMDGKQPAPDNYYFKQLEEKLTKVQQELEEEKKRRIEAEEEVEKQKKALEAKKNEPATFEVCDLQNTQEVSQAQGSTSSAGQESTTGHIIVEKIDPDGEYVDLRNISHEDQQLRGWELHVRVNNRKPIIQTFEDFVILKNGGTVNVKWKQKWWSTGDRLLITLYSDTGEVYQIKHSRMLEIGNSQIKFLELDTSSASQDSDTGHIIVDEVDPEGKYVRLKNTSDKKQKMKDWELHIQVDNRKPIIYTFDSKFKLNPGQTVTIWSKESGVTPNPTTDLVSSESWSSGEQLLVTLYRDTGEEVSMKNVDNTNV